MTTNTTGTVTDLISAGEALYTELSGGTVSTTAANNINDAGAVVSLVVGLAARNITAVDVSGIVGGLVGVVNGITTIVTAAKIKTTATAATTTAAS